MFLSVLDQMWAAKQVAHRTQPDFFLRADSLLPAFALNFTIAAYLFINEDVLGGGG